MKIEKVARLRYIRALEKFSTRAISLLKHSDFEAKEFKQKVQNNYEILKKIKPVRLDSSYLVKLENYANMILSSIEHVEDFDDKKDTLLKEANLLHKEKVGNSYKKDKHKKDRYNDGY